MPQRPERLGVWIEPVDAPVPAADPEAADLVLVDRGDVIARQARRIFGIVAIHDEISGLRIEPAEAGAARADPDPAILPRQNRQRIPGRLREAIDPAVSRPVAKRLAIGPAYPDVTLRIGRDGGHRAETVEDLLELCARFGASEIDLEESAARCRPDRGSPAGRQRGDVGQGCERAIVQWARATRRAGGVEHPQPRIGGGEEDLPGFTPDKGEDIELIDGLRAAVEPAGVEAVTIEASRGPDPQVPSDILDQRVDVMVAEESLLVPRAMDSEAVPVVAIQSFLGSEPEKPLAILQDRLHRRLRKPVVH